MGELVDEAVHDREEAGEDATTTRAGALVEVGTLADGRAIRFFTWTDAPNGPAS